MIDSYQTHQGWQAYLPFFPKIDKPFKVNEEYLNLNNRQVHVDSVSIEGSNTTVILIHGVGGYGRFLYPIGQEIAKGGVSYLAPDLPGYGLSPAGKNLCIGDWVKCIYDLVEKEFQNSKNIVLFGLSLGGILAYEVASMHQGVKALIATTLIVPGEPQIVKRMASSPVLAMAAPCFLAFSNKFAGSLNLPIRWFTKMGSMSHNPKFNTIVAQDKLGGGASVPLSFLHSLLKFKPSTDPIAFNKPVLLVHPEKDSWTPYELSEPFVKSIKGPVEISILKNCGHAPIETPGNLQLRDAVLNFLKKIN